MDRDQIVIGHDAEVDIDLDSSEISSIHCLVEKRGPQFFICDLGSTQGTYKNGQPVLDEVIGSGEEFSIGPFRIVFFVGAPKPVHTPNASSEIIIEPVAPAAAIAAVPTQPETQAPTPTPVVAPVAPAQPVVEKAPTSALDNPALDPSAKVGVAKPSPLVPVSKSGKSERPQIKSETISSSRGQQFIKRRTVKGAKTFAPDSEVKDLRDYIRPGKGKLVEVIVTWQERIITTYHFAPTGMKKLGKNGDIQVPDGAAPKDWTFLDLTSNVQVRTTSEMKVESSRDGVIKQITDPAYRLQQSETLFVSLVNGMQLIVRFAPVAPVVPFESPLILSSSEFTGILAALIIAALASLIVSVTAPKVAQQEEEVQRVAQVIFERPPVVIPTPPAPPTPPPEPPKLPEPPKPKPPPPEPKKVVQAEKQSEVKNKGDVKKPEQKAQAAQTAAKASEVKPKDSKLTAKMFTSTKQGGAIKTGDKSAANAKSKEPDPSNSGLLAAFGSGGSRSKLDKAYSGTGELLGAGEKATGSSGFNENRAGDDVGSKFKDTGAGGKGTATVGIAGVGTKGRGTGMSEYGSASGFGAKDQVDIKAGGAEEDFSGSIDKEAVRRVIRSAITSFKACYEREYKRDSKLEGKVAITWEIHEKGVAMNARVNKALSTINNSSVEECVRSRLLTLRFPEPPNGSVAEVTFPFMFQGQK